ncbi:phosphotransferase family protein [Skermania sp. ID1734]|nr:phosphotransferase family protein [Skermania sp. ID1734]TSD99347.1 phosphotransferase family protein [Skermania sp. ID1734]
MSTAPVDDPDRHLAQVARPSESIRDPELLRDRLQAWLETRLDPAAEPLVEEVHPPTGNGMSSETILLDASWCTDAQRSSHPLVVRVAPDSAAMPIFPFYNMRTQFDMMRTVAECTRVPVPEVYWHEPDPAALGGEFFVMRRVDGQIPPDVMPYNFGSWVTEASDAERAVLESATVRVLTQLHAAPTSRFGFLGDATRTAQEALRDHVAEQRAYYEWTVAASPRSPLIERCFDALAQALPADARPCVVSWGDARIGNVIYREFTPVAVLDWEMAAQAPREMDLGWMIFLHRFFEDIAAAAGLPGLPGFLRRERVADTYESLTGAAVRDLDWYTMYAALRHAIVMFRVQSRAIHFGQASAPDNPDDMIMHRATLESMLAGEYWDGLD